MLASSPAQSPKVVLAGLWTSMCIVGPALSALDQGFEVYVIADACWDVSDEAHERAMDRMVPCGAEPAFCVSTRRIVTVN